jgi:hypothetical protein
MATSLHSLRPYVLILAHAVLAAAHVGQPWLCACYAVVASILLLDHLWPAPAGPIQLPLGQAAVAHGEIKSTGPCQPKKEGPAMSIRPTASEAFGKSGMLLIPGRLPLQ